MKPLGPAAHFIGRAPYKPPFMRHRPIVAARELDAVIANAIDEGKKVMSVIDKIALLRQRREELNKKLDGSAQAMLDRYAAAEKKSDQAFAAHNAQLDAEEKELAELEHAVAAMSNMGNLPGS